MIDFDFKLPDMEKITTQTKDKAKRVLMKSMFKMEELAVNNAPSNDGFLRQNISLFPQLLSEEYFLTSNASYSAAMEYGTRPFYAPIKPLKKWAAKKIGNEDIAYAIRAKIAKEGIKAQPFMRPALFQVKEAWVKQFAAEEMLE